MHKNDGISNKERTNKKQKIVVLDGAAFNPGDLSWRMLNIFGDVQIFDDTSPEQLLERSIDASILVINKVQLHQKIIAQLPNLQLIAVTATGYNNVDVTAAKANGVVVSNVQAYSTHSVAQHSMALLLALCNRVAEHHQSVQEGQWTKCANFAYWNYPLVELANKRMGIVGFGKIGQQMARIAQAMGMQVWVHHKHPERDANAVPNVVFCELATLFETADVVSLHLPLKINNRAFVNKDLLQKMKPTAYLLNTSRGALINEQDLAEVLNKGQIAGAGLDVLSTEPPMTNNPLLKAKNCCITPHNAWASYEARNRMMDILYHNIQGFVEGTPQNVVEE